eukprot:COSAG02_NODE_5802_length_4026_cov_4.072320_8_plen_38_part_00
MMAKAGAREVVQAVVYVLQPSDTQEIAASAPLLSGAE